MRVPMKVESNAERLASAARRDLVRRMSRRHIPRSKRIRQIVRRFETVMNRTNVTSVTLDRGVVDQFEHVIYERGGG